MKASTLISAFPSRRSQPLRALFLGTFSLVFSNCSIVPPHSVSTPVPSISGKIIENQTGKPVSGATVGFAGLAATETSTDTTGSFTTKPTQNIQFTVLDPFYLTQQLRLVVEAEGFQPNELSVTRSGELDGWSYLNDAPVLRLDRRISGTR